MIIRYSFRFLKYGAIRTTTCRCFASSSDSKSAATEEFLARVGKSRKTVAVQEAKPDAEFYTEKPEYPPITVPFFNTGFDGIKAEKKEFAEFVKAMPTVQEKIFAVNPYERPWARGENRWHRQTYLHPQAQPRAIFRVHSIPEHYNLLPFYQYITKTHCVDGLPTEYYAQGKNIDREVAEFSPLVLELIQNEQKSFSGRRFSPSEYVSNVADQLTSAAAGMFASAFPHLAESQITRNSSVQAAWVRGGFHTLYPDDDKKPWRFGDDFINVKSDGKRWGKILLGDDRRRLGEFAFCLRDTTGVSLRNKHPLPEVVPVDDPICKTPVTPFVYAPLTVGLLPDKDGPLYWAPGYEYGDPYEFNSVQFYSIVDVMRNVQRFSGADPGECYADFLRSACVTLSFATLIGQAHYLGFTQHNDLTYPLTTQMILTDGQFWHFSVYQLNSIALINHWEESDTPTNIAWCSGTMKLYESVDQNGFQGLNEDVLKMITKFLLMEPKERPDRVMRPYLIDRASADADLLQSAETHATAITRTT